MPRNQFIQAAASTAIDQESDVSAEEGFEDHVRETEAYEARRREELIAMNPGLYDQEDVGATQPEEEVLEERILDEVNDSDPDEDDMHRNARKTASMNLAIMNKYAQIQKTVQEHSFVHMCKKWARFQTPQDLASVATIDRFTDALVKKMNDFVGQINFSAQDTKIAVRYLKQNNSFGFYFKTVEGFKTMLSHIKITVYNEADLHAVENYDRHRTRVMYAGRRVNLNPILKKQTTRATTNEEDQTVSKVQLRLEEVSIALIWLRHKNHAIFNQMVCNPRPMNFKGRALPTDLNTWAGFAPGFTRDEVKSFTEWDLMMPLFNHLNYSMVETESQFVDMLSRTCLFLQQPYLKQGVCICIGGPEGTFKTAFFNDLLGRIIGANHYTHVQSMKEVTGEFNSLLADKILVLIDESLELSKEEQSVLKNLITGNTQRCSAKYQDVTYRESFLHLVILSNWFMSLVNTGRQGRRFICHYMDHAPLMQHPYYQAKFKGDNKKYFTWLLASMLDNDCRGLKTFANFLYNCPLGNFDHRNTEPTTLLMLQKLRSCTLVEQFWCDCLINVTNDSNGIWAPKSSAEELYRFFLRWKGTKTVKDQSTLEATAKKQKLKKNDMSFGEFWNMLNILLPIDTKGVTVDVIQSGGGCCITALTFNNGPNDRNSFYSGWWKCCEAMERAMPGFKTLLYVAEEDNPNNNNRPAIPACKKSFPQIKAERLAKITEEELLVNWCPETFNGEPLRYMLSGPGRFRIYGEDEWKPEDLEDTNLSHSQVRAYGIGELNTTISEDIEKAKEVVKRRKKETKREQKRQRAAEEAEERRRIQQVTQNAVQSTLNFGLPNIIVGNNVVVHGTIQNNDTYQQLSNLRCTNCNSGYVSLRALAGSASVLTGKLPITCVSCGTSGSLSPYEHQLLVNANRRM
jgi:hypothetical protein